MRPCKVAAREILKYVFRKIITQIAIAKDNQR